MHPNRMIKAQTGILRVEIVISFVNDLSVKAIQRRDVIG